jgi:Holliday junction resolvase-like predicted endonuclease
VKKIRTRSAISKQNRLGGAKAERDVRKWLIGLGFEVSQRQSQYRSGKVDGNELVVGGILAIEVKRHKDIGLGTKKLSDACEQSKNDAMKAWSSPHWCVIWRPTGGRQHFLTYHNEQGHRVTLDSDEAVTHWVRKVVGKDQA